MISLHRTHVVVVVVLVVVVVFVVAGPFVLQNEFANLNLCHMALAELVQSERSLNGTY